MELKGYILNCFILGEEKTYKEDGSWVLNKIALSFGGYDLLIVQHPEIIRPCALDYKGQAVDTTEVTIFNVNEGNMMMSLKNYVALAHSFHL